jgi:hypothetical protein
VCITLWVIGCVRCECASCVRLINCNCGSSWFIYFLCFTRSPLLLLTSAFSAFLLLTYMASRTLYDQYIPCPTTYYLGVFLFVLYIFPYLLRCYRLVKVFDLNIAKAGHINNERLSKTEEKSAELKAVPKEMSFSRGESFQTVIAGRKSFTERRLLRILFVLMFILSCILGIVQGVLSTSYLKPNTNICETVEGYPYVGCMFCCMFYDCVLTSSSKCTFNGSQICDTWFDCINGDPDDCVCIPHLQDEGSGGRVFHQQ